MNPDNETIQSDTATERLLLWSEALRYLAEEGIASELVLALNTGDRERFDALIRPIRFFEPGACIDIVDTLTKIINFGAWHMEERCEVVLILYPPSTSAVNGKLYRLADGTFVFVSERLWFDYHKRASQDPAWRAANKSFLETLGILSCSWVPVSDSEIVSIEKSKTLCFPTVIDPF